MDNEFLYPNSRLNAEMRDRNALGESTPFDNELSSGSKKQIYADSA